MILAGLVLVVACINIANLLLVRGAERQQEMAIRSAIGAPRRQLIWEMLADGILLALAGAIAGIGFGRVSSGLLASIPMHIDVPIRLDFSFDWRVFAFGFAAALVTGFLAGVVPALRASRANVAAILHEGGRSFSAGRGTQRFRNTLVVLQVAGSLVLLIVGGLFIRSLNNARHMYLGFDPSSVVNVSMDVREAGYDAVRGESFYRELEDRVRSLPGVSSVSMAFSVPFGYYRESGKVYVQGAVLAPGERPPELFYNAISPGYFETLKIPLLRGRGFTETDDENRPLVSVVNEAATKRFWPGEDPIGKQFSLNSTAGPFMRVVGLVKDGNYISPAESIRPYFFLPLAQHYMPVRTLQVRSVVQPRLMMMSIQQQIRALDANLPVVDVQTMSQAMEGINGFFLFRIGAGLATILGGLGLFLAAVGTYGVVSYATRQRTQEMGIRLAFGAEPSSLRNLVFKQGMRLLILGVAIGLLLAILATAVISNLLLGVRATDPTTFAFVALLIIIVGLAACYIPARRAARVDPLFLMRNQ